MPVILSRRSVLKAGALAAIAATGPVRWLSSPVRARAAASSDRLRKFVQPLRVIGAPGGVPLAVPDAVRPSWAQPGATHYTIDIGAFDDRLHPDLPATRLWGYGQGSTNGFRHLGGVIAAKRGTPVQVTFRNHLPDHHILPVDTTIMGTEHGVDRASVHLHGGKVPWSSDGGPHAWWTSMGHQGESFVNNAALRPGQRVPANEAEYFYPNDQGSRLMWYHDHALGITRLNAYAGIASGYVIYDDYELGLVATAGLPGPLDPRTHYLVFQDKVFVPSDVETTDPKWTQLMPGTRRGDLWYAHEYDADVSDDHPLGHPSELPVSVVPEFFGDTILVNGTVYPFLEVEQRQYRFRLLNACSSRFLNPRLMYARGGGKGQSTEPGVVAGPALVQIQTEGGFLPSPVYLDGSILSRLVLAPAERADLIVDFRDVPDGSNLILVNDAASPYPMGDPVLRTTKPGYGPDAATLLQIRVKKRMGRADAPIRMPANLTPSDPFLVAQEPGVPTAVPAGVPVRRLTLNEGFDGYGRLLQMLGTDAEPDPGAGFGRMYMDEPTENVSAGSTEVWEILNLSEDTHPVHFHLANVQVLSRRAFDMAGYGGGEPAWMGDAHAPDANELGWKETVRMNAGEATRVLMRFDLPVVPFAEPESPRTGGREYVWHCHILEHEEHDMMRPLVVS
jgi:spore coat protein A, manganese oxidase